MMKGMASPAGALKDRLNSSKTDPAVKAAAGPSKGKAPSDVDYQSKGVFKDGARALAEHDVKGVRKL